MTLEDFERAKVIQSKLATINANFDAIETVRRDSFSHLPPSNNHTVLIDGFATLIVDLRLLDMIQEYYEQQYEELNDEFASLGKEKTNEVPH